MRAEHNCSPAVFETYWGLKLNVILFSWQSKLASLCLRRRAASVGVDRLNHPTEWRIHLMQEPCLLCCSTIVPSLFPLSIYNKFTHKAKIWYEPRWKSMFVMNLSSQVLLEPLHRLQERLEWLSFCWQWATSRLLARIHWYAPSCINARISCWSNNVLIFLHL